MDGRNGGTGHDQQGGHPSRRAQARAPAHTCSRRPSSDQARRAGVAGARRGACAVPLPAQLLRPLLVPGRLGGVGHLRAKGKGCKSAACAAWDRPPMADSALASCPCSAAAPPPQPAPRPRPDGACKHAKAWQGPRYGPHLWLSGARRLRHRAAARVRNLRQWRRDRVGARERRRAAGGSRGACTPALRRHSRGGGGVQPDSTGAVARVSFSPCQPSAHLGCGLCCRLQQRLARAGHAAAVGFRNLTQRRRRREREGRPAVREGQKACTHQVCNSRHARRSRQGYLDTKPPCKSSAAGLHRLPSRPSAAPAQTHSHEPCAHLGCGLRGGGRLEVAVAVHARARNAALPRLRGKRRGGATLAGRTPNLRRLCARRLQRFRREAGATDLQAGRRGGCGGGGAHGAVGPGCGMRFGSARRRERRRPLHINIHARRTPTSRRSIPGRALRDDAARAMAGHTMYVSLSPTHTLAMGSAARWRSSRLRPEGEAPLNMALRASVPKGAARPPPPAVGDAASGSEEARVGARLDKPSPLPGEDSVPEGLRAGGAERADGIFKAQARALLRVGRRRRRRRRRQCPGATPRHRRSLPPERRPMHVDACGGAPARHSVRGASARRVFVPGALASAAGMWV